MAPGGNAVAGERIAGEPGIRNPPPLPSSPSSFCGTKVGGFMPASMPIDGGGHGFGCG
jgi:hypothetical protein